MIYLDNNATTRPSAAAVEAVVQALTENWGNPSSVHRFGQEARARVEVARRTIAELLGTRPRHLTFTGSGTEAIDLAIRGTLAAAVAVRTPSQRRLITTRTEHAAVRDLAQWLADREHVEVRWAPVDADGVVDPAAIDRLIDQSTALVSIQWANNETGVVQPVEAIGRICRDRGVLFHCDATQWIGKEPVGLGEGGDGWCDLLTCAPHKFHGPKGLGILWARPGVRFVPMIHGTQEQGRRGGTENVPAILGAAAAAAEATAWLGRPDERLRLARLRDEFEQDVTRRVPDAVINGARTGQAQRIWNTTSIAFPRLEAEALLLLLSERGICASAGAACSSGSLEPSPVLLAMGVPEEEAHGSVRFSLSRQSTEAELRDAAVIIAECVARLRTSMTPR